MKTLPPTLFLLLAAGASSATPAELRLRSGVVTFQGDQLRTGSPASAAEAPLHGDSTLRLAGHGSARTGNNVHLEKGLALVSSGKGLLGRRSLSGNVGPLDLSLKGTALISRLPDQPLKITILEGTATARLTGKRSHFIALESGMMLMMSDQEIAMPRPSEVRLSRLRETSGLMARPFGPLAAESAMTAATARQEKEIAKRKLVASNVTLRGATASVGGESDSGSDSRSSGGGSSGSSSSGGSSSSSSSSSGDSSSGAAAAAAGPGGVHVCLDCLSHVTPTGAVSGNDANRLAQIRSEQVTSGIAPGTTSRNAALPGGKPSAAVSVSGEASSGDLGTALAADSVVTVTNSSDLTDFAEAVVLANLGEHITVAGSSFTNQPGGISLDAGTIYQRTLTLRQNNLTADVIKARGFNVPGSNALLLEGGSFNATQLVRLYGEGGGALRFRGDVLLNAPNADLAASTLEIDAGSRVRAAGNVRAFSDNHNYDKAGFGTLEAIGTKTQLPFASRPRY